MKRAELCLIGNLGEEGIISGGQIEKTRELKRYFENHYSSFFAYNMYGKKRVRLLMGILGAVIHSKKAMIITYNRLFYKELPFIICVAFFSGTKVYDMTVGGIAPTYLQGHPLRVFFHKRVAATYVETKTQIRDFNKFGIKRVKYQPTFKEFNEKTISEVHDASIEPLKICFFGRVTEEKGIREAFDIIEEIWKNGTECSFHIYGPLDPAFEGEMHAFLRSHLSGVSYGGIIPEGKVVDILSNEDILLFPTKHISEGFPGTFIESMAAGLVIISTEYEHFHEIIEDGYNGYLIKDRITQSFVAKIHELDKNRKKLMEMKANSLKESKKYKTHNVLKEMDADLRN